MPLHFAATRPKFLNVHVEYYIFPISGNSRIQYARTRFGTNTRTIRVHDTGARYGCTIQVHGFLTTIVRLISAPCIVHPSRAPASCTRIVRVFVPKRVHAYCIRESPDIGNM